MSKINNYELFEAVNNIFNNANNTEQGLIKCSNVFKIVIPSKMENDFCFPDSFGLTAIAYIEKFYHKAKIEFKDTKDIEIFYYIEKSFKW